VGAGADGFVSSMSGVKTDALIFSLSTQLSSASKEGRLERQRQGRVRVTFCVAQEHHVRAAVQVRPHIRARELGVLWGPRYSNNLEMSLVN
jgi:histidyl-tRNA synthetase